MIQRGSKYLEALVWIAQSDDTVWLHDDPQIPSVTARMVADLFGKKIDQVIADLEKAIKIIRRKSAV